MDDIRERKTYNITNKEIRVDKFLSDQNNNLSRSYIKTLIDEGRVFVNDKLTRGSYKLKKGDTVELLIPSPVDMDLKATPMELDIIYEDEDLIVVNKPPGLVVHPAPGNRDNTLVNALLAYTDKLSGINGVKRPGIVHRIDKDTSGVLVIARNDNSHRQLVSQFKNRETMKIYRTLIKGKLPYERGKIDAPIGRNSRERKKMAVVQSNSKKAVTLFEVLEYLGDYTYVEVKLETGRTHQIRVHFSYLGYPILGDEKYGRSSNKLGVERQLLHAYKLGLNHPSTNKWMEFTAAIPADFESILNKLH